jgi:hypothetical protein
MVCFSFRERAFATRAMKDFSRKLKIEKRAICFLTRRALNLIVCSDSFVKLESTLIQAVTLNEFDTDG